MKNIRFGNCDGDIAIRVCGAVVFQGELGVVKRHGHFGREHSRRDSRECRRWEVEIPVFDFLNRQEVLVSIFMGDDGSALRIEPPIAVGVIEVPVRIYQVLTDRAEATAASRICVATR